MYSSSVVRTDGGSFGADNMRIDDRHGEPRGFVTAVADGPSGAAGNAQCARKFVERMESSKLGGLRKLPDFGRLPRLDFR